MKESDIKWLGKNFSVALNRKLKRFEVLKQTITCSYVVGFGKNVQKCIRTAKKLELYPDSI